MLKQNEIIKIKSWCDKTFFQPNNLAIDSFDFNHEADFSLEFSECKEDLRNKLKTFLKISPTKAEMKNTLELEQHEQQKIIKEQEELADREFQNALMKISESNKDEMIKEMYKIPIEYTKSVIGGFHNSFIWLGKQGQGKTTTILNTLKENKSDFVYHNGISTPKALYEFLYENRNEKIIVFDDCAGLINNLYALSIILSALWSFSEKRIVTWNSTRSAIASCPTKYLFNSKIIIIANKIPDSEYSKVVMSRCLVYDVNLDYKQIIKMMSALGDKEVVDYLKQNSSEATKNFDLRLLRKAENFKRYDKTNWKELVKPMLDKDEELEMILNGLSSKEWCEKTNLSRRSYFRKKKEVYTNVYKS